MEITNTTIIAHSFSLNAPFKQPIVIIHLISMTIAFLGCYPLLLTQQLKRQKNYLLLASLFFAAIGFISSSFIQVSTTNTTTILLRLAQFILFSLVSSQLILFIARLKTKKATRIPKWIDLTLGWLTLIMAISYLTLAALVFTESCNQDDIFQSQCLLPVAMGTGFLIYGTVTLLHLLAIIKLPRPSTPEYYEGIILTFWGFVSLLFAGTPILGTEWRALNLGLLWFTGGLFSISLSVQTWIPALRERNIINALIICLTGRAIITGLTDINDIYAQQVHIMLGYLLILGAITRSIQIIFRKSPADNLQYRMFSQNIDPLDIDDEEEDNITTTTKDILSSQQTEKPKCRHKFIFATLTLISGLLSSLLAISVGILFMGSNIGWIGYMKYYINDPSTYINITLAVSFLWSVYIFGLCTLYKNLKAQNAIHQYEYLELENNNIIVEQQQSRYTAAASIATNESARWSSSSSLSSISNKSPPPLANLITTSSNKAFIIPTNTHNSSAIMMSTSPTQQQEISQNEILNSPVPLYYQLPPAVESPAVQTSEKTIRPSELRAKRRSLLVQSPILNNPPANNRARSSSNFGGVGGILPDEIINLQYPDRKSWLSTNSASGSSSLDSSSAPNSPSFDQRPYTSISSTLPLGLNKQQRHDDVRRNSVNHHRMEEDQQSDDGSRSTTSDANSSQSLISSRQKLQQQQRWSGGSSRSNGSVNHRQQ